MAEIEVPEAKPVDKGDGARGGWEKMVWGAEQVHRIGQQVDKAVLTIASGAIVLSVSYCSGFPPASGWLLIPLGSAWAGLLFAIVADLIAMHLNNLAAVDQCNVLRHEALASVLGSGEGYETELEEQRAAQEKFSKHAKKQNAWAVANLVSLIVGLFLLCGYAFVNLYLATGGTR